MKMNTISNHKSNTMRKILSFLILLPIFLNGQTQSENYIKTIQYKQPTTSPISNPDITNASTNITYFDGLGRPIQKINQGQSNSGTNIVIPIEYDEFGRQQKEYLPYSSTNNGLNYETSAVNDILSYSLYQGETPFSEKLFDQSPLDKVVKQAAPGNEWKMTSGHEIKFDYGLNTTDEVKKFKVARSYDGTAKVYNYTLSSDGYYLKNRLYKNIVKNENWSSGNDNTNEEFKDQLGNVILKKTYNNNVAHETNYVYDDIGNLIYVIPPLASDDIVQINSTSTPYVYSKGFYISDFLVDSNGNPVTSGGGGMTIKIENSTLKLLFSFSIGPNSTFNLNNELSLNAVQPIPDMILGHIDLNYGGNHQYIAKIINNKLKFEDYTPNDPPVYFTSSSSLFNNIAKPLDSSVFGPTTTYTYTLNTSIIDGLCYQYKYDDINRLVAKKIPSKQWEYIVYDKLNRPVAAGPVFSPSGDETLGVLITEYDLFGRVTQTGWKAVTIDETSRGSLQSSINSGSNPFTLRTNDVLTKNYYDNYSFPDAPTIPASLPTSNYPITQNVKGLATGTWVKVIDPYTPNLYELSYTLYDNKYRPVRTYTKNHLGGYTQVDSNIDFAGKTIYRITKHKRTNSDTETIIRDNFTYTPQDRLLSHTQQLDSQPEQLISKITYNELGQVISKQVGGTDTTGAFPLQKVDYTYNIRGWLKQINDITNLQNDLFAFKINYNDNEITNLGTGETAVTKLYNGNISETLWRTASDNKTRKYGYNYDNLNRLTSAVYQEPLSANLFESFNENASYDKGGNILSLQRNQALNSAPFKTSIDILQYTYNSTNKNQLDKVFDLSFDTNGFKDISSGNTDYTYDIKGNMKTDINKGITNINYNHLNLPTKIEFGTQSIVYLYNASGIKIQKKVMNQSGSTITDYINGFVYQYSSTYSGPTPPVLKMIFHDEGYIEKERILDPNDVECFCTEIDDYKYVFQYKDHVGNVRLSYSDKDKNGVINFQEILEENNYYPFGLKHQGYNTALNSTNYVALKYRMQNKEWQDELGLNWYDFGGRAYIPDIVRTPQIDPLAEKFYDLSPQSFLNNNPLSFIDPTGMGTEDWYKDKNGIMRWDKNVKTQDDVDKVSPGGKYVGETHSTKTATYYKDGSAFFKNEFEGYKHLIANSNMQTGKNEVEHIGYITNKGVAVLPTEGTDFKGKPFKNWSLRSKIDVKGYEISGFGESLKVNFHGIKINPIGWIHTHPDSEAGFNQSSGDTYWTYKLGVPSFVIGRNTIYGQTYDNSVNDSYFELMSLKDFKKYEKSLIKYINSIK